MFSGIFIERPRLAMVVSLVLMLTGVISLFKLPVAEYPDIAPPTLSTTGNDSGSYTCRVTFQSGTDSDIAMVNLQNAVSRAEVNLSSDVTKHGISFEKRGSDLLAMFAFLTDGSRMHLMELNNYVDSNIKDAICRIPGVSSAEIMASREYSMRLWLNPLRMSGLGISTADITAAVESQKIQVLMRFTA